MCFKSQKHCNRKAIKRGVGLLSALLLTTAARLYSQNMTTQQSTKTITIDARAPRIQVSPTMWGIFFEDINFAADGGIYAELIKNRSFEFDDPFMGWRRLEQKNSPIKVDFNGKLLITNRGTSQPHTGNHRYAHIDLSGYFGLENEGFRAMGFKSGEPYRFTAAFRLKKGTSLAIQLAVVNDSGIVQFKTPYKPLAATDTWTTFEEVFTATSTINKGKLLILFKGSGALDADMLSLFPVHTWKNRPGGLRKDLVQKLYNLHPGFIRFPGGCIVEGRTLVNRYQWKNTVGPVAERTTIANRWQTEFKAPRNAPDYYQSYGLGFYEYFLLAEDLHAAPLPILNCGMACQYNSGEVAADLEPYIQNALDLIEFANGDTSTPYGHLRAKMGHPKPFHLKYLGIGNEQWESQYFDRYKIFESRLKLAHPEIQLVSGSGPYNSGKWFDDAWSTLRKLHPSLIDEHYYAPPEWFLDQAGRYDDYDRKGPKVFAGEYAAHGKSGKAPESANSLYSALTEAAFMTGLERNADVVRMASYAPLLANVNAWQWRPDLIWFDNLHSIATPNYYVQQIFSLSKGTEVLATTSAKAPLKGQDSLYASTTLDSTTGKIYIKLVNVSNSSRALTFRIKGLTTHSKSSSILGKWTLFTADSPQAYNSLQQPGLVRPVYLNFGQSNLMKRKQSPKDKNKPEQFLGYPLPLINNIGDDLQLKVTTPAGAVSVFELSLNPQKAIHRHINNTRQRHN